MTAEPNRTEPLEILLLYKLKEKKNLTDNYSIVNLFVNSVTPVPNRTPVLHYNLRGNSHLLNDANMTANEGGSSNVTMLRLEYPQTVSGVIQFVEPRLDTVEISDPPGWLRQLAYQHEQAKRDL
jgi:hypothetical protein